MPVVKHPDSIVSSLQNVPPIKFCRDFMVSCEISSPGLQLLSQLGSREECSQITLTSTTSRWPVVPQFCLSCSSLFFLRVTCGDPPACRLCALLSVLRFVTALWLKVKVHHLIQKNENHPNLFFGA